MSHSGRQSRLSFRDSSPDASPNLDDAEQNKREERVSHDVSADIEDALSEFFHFTAYYRRGAG
jgi:hypothetical protein